MNDVQLKLDESGKGFFYVEEGNEQLGEMEISIAGNELTVYHTEVFPKGEGRGIGKQLLAAMVAYARKNGLKVTALCPFVHAQFKKHPDIYADVWNNGE